MKKVLALVLVAVMAFGMASVGFADGAYEKAAGMFAENISYGYGYDYVTEIRDVLKDGKVIGASGYLVKSGKDRLGYLSATHNTVTYDHDIAPQDEVVDYINLYVGMFDWGGTQVSNNSFGRYLPAYAYTGSYYTKYDAATNKWTDLHEGYANPFTLIQSSDIRKSKIAVRTSVAAGSKALDSVSIVNKDSVIKVKYVEEFVSTKELDFDFTVYLTIDGKRYTDEGLTFVGTLANPITEVYEDDDYVDLSDGQVAEAMDFNKDIEVDLGNGVTIHTKFFKTKKYYGICTRDADEYDDIVFAKYADVDNVITLKTVGLNSTGDIVELSTDYADYFVYDANMNYIGQATEKLRYSTKYYLANKKLEVTDDNTVTEEPGEAPSGEPLNPNMGGDDLPSSNPNGNPSTGR